MQINSYDKNSTIHIEKVSIKFSVFRLKLTQKFKYR